MDRTRDQTAPPRSRSTEPSPSLDCGRYRPGDSPATFELLVGTACALAAGLGLFAYVGNLWPRVWGPWPLVALALLAFAAARCLRRAWQRR